MSKKYIVELRPNRPLVTDTDPPEAYFGITDDDSMLRGKVVSTRERAHEFHNETEVRNVLNRMPDAFFYRYYPTTVEVE